MHAPPSCGENSAHAACVPSDGNTLATPIRAACWNCENPFAIISRPARAVRCEPEQVVITAGTQQALDIVIRVMQGPDREVWIEDPGYALTRLVLVAA